MGGSATGTNSRTQPGIVNRRARHETRAVIEVGVSRDDGLKNDELMHGPSIFIRRLARGTSLNFSRKIRDTGTTTTTVAARTLA